MKIFREGFLGLLFFSVVQASPKDIVDAILCGDEQRVKELVHVDNINVLLDFENRQVTPFFLACQLSQTFIAEYLVQFEPNVEFKCSECFDRQAIHEVSANNAKNHMLLLLAMGANPESLTNNGETPLSIAKKYNHKSIICILEKVLLYKPQDYKESDDCLLLIKNCLNAGELGLPIEIINEILRTESSLRFKFLRWIFLLSLGSEKNMNDAVCKIKESLLSVPLQRHRILSVVSQEFVKLENSETCLAALWWIKAYLQKNWEKFMQKVNVSELSISQKNLYKELLDKKSEFISQSGCE